MAKGSGIFLGIAKFTIVIINLIISLIGLAVFVFGVILKAGSLSVVLAVIPLSILSQEARDIYFNGNNAVGLDIAKISSPISIPLIVIGGFLLLTGIFGCCGVCCRNKIFLGIYMFIVSMLVVAQIIIIIVVYQGTFTEIFKEAGVSTIVNYYTSFNSTTSFPTIMWNAIMSNLECCGVNNHMDFMISKHYVAFQPNNETSYFPQICCRNVTKKPYCSHSSITNVTSFADTGCYKKVVESIMSYGTIGLVVIGVFISLQVIIVVIAGCIACRK
ncbi:hypothetical protein A3Q56_06604 [Intoshia linei]|uniref:Tetraspanin n=1 Tax=Intoshia linei TaxID=1819745 RepID=A0A177AUL8_9BILA|nr:hypothetical protein A3Q56_06604 [Intoshia linei]